MSHQNIRVEIYSVEKKSLMAILLLKNPENSDGIDCDYYCE